ncbi:MULTISPECIES: PucR family transcriptional regulator [unclassified Corynebacterium]|uniref:PucR family transcriptional regulator n=1 Tax=unclassified Corynebacterium TaxID=2624378 RepID=UPI0030AE17E7
MKLTVASLSARPDLGLTLLSAFDTARVTPVEWAHAIDRVDSDRWIAPGTLVLTSGYQFLDDDSHLADQIDKLKRAGACAVAVDTGGRWETVPDVLIRRGEDIGFPVLAVNADTPFTTVVRAVAEDITASRVRRLSNLITTQSNLVRTMLRAGIVQVVKDLARELDAVVIVVDNHGGVTASAGETQLIATTLTPPPYSPQVSGSKIHARGARLVQPLTGAVVGQGALIIDSSRQFDESDRLLVSYAAAIISLSRSRSLAVHVAEERLRKQAMADLIHGETPSADNLALFGLDQDTSVHGLYIRGRNLDTELLTEELQGLGVRFLLAEASSRNSFVAIHDGAPAIARTLLKRLSARSIGVSIGIGARVALHKAALTVNQAEVALPKEAAVGALRSIEEMPAHDLIFGLLNDGAAHHILTGGAYRKLIEHDVAHNDDLVEAAEAFIDSNGRFEAMARKLGIHRQTARTRADRIEDIVGASLDDPDLRAELWLAFRAAKLRH